ncbi:MAG: 4-alpha-glucanotransferase, partial [Oscillospiraceae bacterium]|nr:4-alpha-glucanotransferase [Oscillospiraceae bacterium]
MHITSLPSPFGIGVMGTSAKKFAEKIKAMGFSIWQVLPLNPPDRFASPYASESAFAGNFMLINPNGLEEMGLITHEEVQKEYYYGSPYTADYEFAYHSRMRVLRSAYSKMGGDLKKQVVAFNESNQWLEEYSLFMAVRLSQDGKPWWEWSDGLFDYKTASKRKDEFYDEQLFWQFVQYIFYKQWQKTKEEINSVGVEILGDMPIYVSMDSSDVWGNTKLFEIDEKTFVPKRVAGVPPDYFSKTGQLWGNPLYDWAAMEKDGYSWWISRLKHATEIYD